MNTLAVALLLAVAPAPVAEYREGGMRVELYAEAGPCVGSARWAVFLQGPVRVPGCWLWVGESVQIAWLDGDFSKVPARVFRKPELL
jgi:hypothetical protein